MDEYAQIALDAGAGIIGACCGSTPEHIRRIRKVVDSYEAGEVPSRETVGERVGLDGSPERISPLNAQRARPQALSSLVPPAFVGATLRWFPLG